MPDDDQLPDGGVKINAGAVQSFNYCRQCGLADVPVNQWGRCESCQQELQDRMEAAEAEAGWDPNP